jgi:hypothetical protein
MKILTMVLTLLSVLYKWSTGADKKADAVAAAKPLLDAMNLPWWVKLPGAITALCGVVVQAIETELLRLENSGIIPAAWFSAGDSIILAVNAAITDAEVAGGTGTDKRAIAISTVQAILAILPLPGWVMEFLTADTIGSLVDAAVAFANAEGWFTHPSVPTIAPAG